VGLKLVLKLETHLALVRKSEFARLCNVSNGRVSQWITAGYISGAAIVGEGRTAMIDVDVAMAQLKERLSVDERFGLNGLSTNLDGSAPRPPGACAGCPHSASRGDSSNPRARGSARDGQRA
jgi:hypothetical protein